MAKFENEFENADVANSTDQLEQEGKTSGPKNKGCCKRVSKFLFSHIGLVVMVILYACGGAALFSLLEQHQEAVDCQEGKGEESTNIVNLKSLLLSYIQFNISSNPADTTKDNETVANANIETWLQDFRDSVLTTSSTYRYTGQDCTEENLKWNFAGALLFSITIFTTIGYGNIAPRTWEGQVVCICYATIGIPLFLMCIANISGVLGDMFRFVYARICCRLCMKKKKKNKAQPIDDLANTNQNSSNPELNNGKTNSIGIVPVSDWANGKNKVPGAPGAKNGEMVGGAKVVDDHEDFDNDVKEDEDDDKVTVPLTVTMIIITFYIIIGAVIFNQFEGWSLIQAGYFCYITLSTIGFGDYVPGQSADDQYKAPKLLLGAFYVLFGMAILAMCFDLMQEEIIAKFTWIGKKLGIVDKDEEDEMQEEAEKNNKALDNEKSNANNEMIKKENDKNLKSNSENKLNYVSEKSKYPDMNSPAPSYNQNANDEYRSSYLQSVVQRQQNNKF